MAGASNGLPREPSIAIIGAGFGGLCAAIRLAQAGFERFTIFEQSDRIGGTWRDNGYPGAACDVPSHLYSFSFERNPDWNRRYSGQAEIQEYLERCADRYQLRGRIRLNTPVRAARFESSSGLWRIETVAGESTQAHFVIAATGQLNRPHVPRIAGLETFRGMQFHSARWNHAHDVSNRDVAVIGTGASAVQFVPYLATRARKLSVYQRSPNWILPRSDRAYSAAEKWVFRHAAPIEHAHRAAIYASHEWRFVALGEHSALAPFVMRACERHLAAQIDDPALRRALTPDYPLGCKRILISDDYYPALAQPNVELVTSPIQRVTPDGVVAGDDTFRRADTLVFGTGFETTSFLAPMEIRGRDGESLHDRWRDGAEAYLGVCVAGFPNLFLLYGPNTNLGHNSIIFMIECQVRYALACMTALRAHGRASIDVRRDAMDAFNRTLQRDLAHTVWSAGCHSWYKTDTGKLTNNWSGYTLSYWWRTRRPDLRAFEMRDAAPL